MYQVIDGPIEELALENTIRTEADGAVIIFRGVARRFSRGRDVVHLEYEAYPEMAEKVMAQIGEEVKARWPVSGIAMVHRTGVLEIGQASVAIAIAAPHRREAFEAGQYAIDRLKEIVPIWKKEVWSDGSQWIGWEHQASTANQMPMPASAASQTRAPLIFQLRVKASPAVVFDAFFKQPQRWLCREASVDVQPGGQLRMCWPDGCFTGHFVQCEPSTVARFTWGMVGDPLPETMVVVRTDSAGGDQTALELEHYGFGAGPDWDPVYVGAARAWATYLKNLRAVLEIGVDLRADDE